MTNSEERTFLGVCLLAAFADGSNSDVERDRIREVVERFKDPGLNALDLYRDVLLKRVQISDLAPQSLSPESRRVAYEMALGVCEADGLLNDAEKGFLGQLRRDLELSEATIGSMHRQADQLAAAATPPVLGNAEDLTPRPATPSATSGGSDTELESMILNHAILAGALELLPGSLATMAIIPLQMRLVYRIGQRHGHSLDRGHIGEFLAAAGIGMGSQILEGYVTKFAKGLLGSVAGGIGRSLASAFTGSAMAFGTTWAVGQLAQRYYAGGRTLTGLQLQQAFQSLMGQARGLQQQYLPQIQQRSRNLDLGEVMRLAGRS